MFSNIKLKVIKKNELLKKYQRILNLDPFDDLNNIDAITNSLNNKLYQIKNHHLLFYDIKKNVEIGLISMHILKVKDKKFLCSGGRFGYNFFKLLINDQFQYSIDEILYALDLYAVNNSFSTCSFAINQSSFSETNFSFPNWESKKITYYIADIKSSCNSDGLNFRNAIVRTNLSRNLKKAKKNKLKTHFSKQLSHIETWYKNCHLKRMDELNGRKWELNFFLNLSKIGTGELVFVTSEQENEILGGCFFLKSNNSYELFMMSTPQKYQLLGVNYLLAETIYNDAYKNDINFVNWQASNPPDSPLVKFKKSWNALPVEYKLFNKKYIESLIFPLPYEKLKDFYIYNY